MVVISGGGGCREMEPFVHDYLRSFMTRADDCKPPCACDGMGVEQSVSDPTT
jgi:hypothetical protein